MDIDGNSLESSADPNITASINEQAHQTNQGLANSYTQPAQAAGRGLLNSHDNFNNSLSFGDRATTTAIKSRYDQTYGRGESALSLESLKNAQSDHIRNLSVATQAAGQEVEMNKQKAILKWKIEQQNKKARGAILGTTLGIVGGVVAGIYSGGTGAAAGYAAGTAAGTAIGES